MIGTHISETAAAFRSPPEDVTGVVDLQAMACAHPSMNPGANPVFHQNGGGWCCAVAGGGGLCRNNPRQPVTLTN